MAILHSCCLFRSIRKGSYASAIYTLIYYLTTSVIAATFLHEQRDFLIGEVERPTGESFLEREAISSTTVIFNILLLACGLCGIVTSLLLMAGLSTDHRELLIPWIFVTVANMLVEASHFLYFVIADTLKFDTFTAIIFTIDFFLNCLNAYSLLCVISQYQEYKSGRVCGRDSSIFGGYRNVQYIAPRINTTKQESQNTPTSERIAKNMLLCPHSNCTIIPEESQINGSLEPSENILMCQNQQNSPQTKL